MNLKTNITNLQEILEEVNNLPESGSSPINCDSEWMSCANLPTTFIAAPGSTTYYLEVPTNVQCILFRNNARSPKYYYCATKTVTGMSFSGTYSMVSADCMGSPTFSDNILSISAGSDFLSAEYIFLYDAY